MAGKWSDTVEVTTAQRRRPKSIIVHVSELRRTQTTFIGRIPVTTAARTLLDLASVVDQEVVEIAVTDAIRRGVVKPAWLRRVLDEAAGRGRRGVKKLRSVVETLKDQRPESLLELKVLKLLLKAGLPEPRTQFIVRSGGILVARVDFAYPEIKLAMEADGYRYHGDASAWRRDLARRNSLTALGWRIIHVTWDDVTRRPSQVVGDIQQAIEARGYR